MSHMCSSQNPVPAFGKTNASTYIARDESALLLRIVKGGSSTGKLVKPKLCSAKCGS